MFCTTFSCKATAVCVGPLIFTTKTSSQKTMPSRNAEQEAEILAWIEAVLGEKVNANNDDYADVLKDGVILCKLMNKISPGAIPKFKTSGPAFLLMENIGYFQKAVKAYGVPDEEIFQTPDLFEARNIPQVTICLFALGRMTQKHPEYTGPTIGPKMAEKNERNFSEEDIIKGRNATISLQAGSNKGASQAGLGGMGNTRHM